MVTAPEFELPDYNNIPVQLPDVKVNETEVDATVERLREQSADFVDVPERGLQMGDFAVIDFEGTIDGKPISESRRRRARTCTAARNSGCISRRKIFSPIFASNWSVKSVNETRLVNVNFPRIFRLGSGREKGGIRCHVREIKQRVLPAIDDAFAAKMVPGKTLADFRHMLEHDLEHEKSTKWSGRRKRRS